MIKKIDLSIIENKQMIYNFYIRHYSAPKYLLPNSVENIKGIYYGYFDGDYLIGITKIEYLSPFLMYTMSTVVHSEYRNQGIATSINDYLEKLAKENGITKIKCNIYVDNIPSIVVKLKRGYLIEGLFRDHDEIGKHEYVLGKVLK
jgi:RimJ/RimL family protein N-acetyltransferase